MSVFSSIPDQGITTLDGVHETELRLTATDWRWSIDIATSTVDATTRISVEHWHETPDGTRDHHQDIDLFLDRNQFTELLARLLAARDATTDQENP